MPMIGSYCNGDKFVRSPVRISAITPAETVGDATPAGRPTQSGIVKHGAMINPGLGGHGPQGLTNVDGSGLEVAYDAAKKIVLPLEFGSGAEGSLVKSIFEPTLKATCFPAVRGLAVLTVVAAEPPAGAFRPAVASTSKTSLWTEGDLIDLSTLPNRALVPGGPSVQAVIEAIRHWQPSSWSEGDPSRYLAATYNNPGGDYPVRDVGPVVCHAVMMLTMAYSLDEKRDLAVALCQIGIDVLGWLQNRTAGFDYGGADGQSGLGGVVQRGYKIALGVAGILLDDATMRAWANSGSHPAFGEDGMLRYIDAADIAADQAALGGRAGRIDYEPGDLGMPEWTETNHFRAATTGDRKPDATYRNIVAPYIAIHALASHMFPGLSAVLGQQVMLDLADRYMERNFLANSADPLNVNKWLRTLTGTDSLTPWELAMWNAYRTASGMPAVWNWS